MGTPELYISMSELLQMPVVTISGVMHKAHVPTLTAVLAGMEDFGKNSFVFDVAHLDCPGTNEAQNLVELMRGVPTALKVHLVCSGLPGKLMSEASLGKRIMLYSSTDELARLLHIEWVSQHPTRQEPHPAEGSLSV